MPLLLREVVEMEKLKNAIKSYFSNGPKTMFIILLILLSSVMSIDAAKKTVIVSIDGKEKKFITFKKSFRDVLESNNIVLGPKDKAAPSLNTKLKKKDKIYIERAVNVTIAVDEQKLNIKTTEDTVDDVFETEGIEVDDMDKVLPSRDVPVKEGLNLVVKRIKAKIVEEKKPINFSTVVRKDENFEKGKTKVVKEGEKGEKVTATNIVYEDGKEVSRKVVNETITKKPVQKVVAVGTRIAIPVIISRGGSGLSKVKSLASAQTAASFIVRSTAYTAGYESTGKRPGDSGFGRTATGTIARRNPKGYSTVAVDPRVIPYGSKLYIEGYGYAIAEDTGGAIKGKKIDVFFNTVSQCMKWGVRKVRVYILK